MNARFWRYVNTQYRPFFERDEPQILEVGSCNLNGSARDFLDIPADATYIGVDWRPGPGVDVVCFAHDMRLGDGCWNVVLSCSMLEHDPYWQKSIPTIIRHLGPDGILLLSWGAALNLPHCYDTAPDGDFHSLPAGYVIDILEKHGLYIHEFLYEGNHFKEGLDLPPESGLGEVCLVAFRDKEYAVGEPRIDTLLPEDRV